MPSLDYAQPSQCPAWPGEAMALPEVSGEMDWKPLVAVAVIAFLVGRSYDH